jgi:hypothetical protein
LDQIKAAGGDAQGPGLGYTSQGGIIMKDDSLAAIGLQGLLGSGFGNLLQGLLAPAAFGGSRDCDDRRSILGEISSFSCGGDDFANCGFGRYILEIDGIQQFSAVGVESLGIDHMVQAFSSRTILGLMSTLTAATVVLTSARPATVKMLARSTIVAAMAI